VQPVRGAVEPGPGHGTFQEVGQEFRVLRCVLGEQLLDLFLVSADDVADRGISRVLGGGVEQAAAAEVRAGGRRVSR
jgi:hypothetical protein